MISWKKYGKNIESMKISNIIAIDGPSGSGKSTVAKILAKELGLVYIDTGAMYRAITYKIFSLGVDLNSDKEIKKILENTNFSYKNSDLFMDECLLGTEIRTQEIDKNVSKVASKKIVRDFLTVQQRNIGEKNVSVIDGRDVGTVIFPDAILKIFLTADIKTRAKRRFIQNENIGIFQENILEIEKQLAKRDLADSTRKFAPLKKS